jgi:hypothetical protein
VGSEQFPLALLNLVVNVRDTPRVGDKLAILTRSIERCRARIHRMAQASKFHCLLGQSQIGGLPIGVKLEARIRVPSAILGGGGIGSKPRSLSRHRESELERSSLEKRSLKRWYAIAEATRDLFEPSQDRAPAPAGSKAQQISFQISAVSAF